jgi:hypothetical protein
MRTETVQYESGQTQPAIPWQVSVFAAAVIAIVFIAMAVNRRKKQAFEAIAAFLKGEAGGNTFFQNFYFRGLYKNRPLLIKHRPGGRNSPSWLVISLEDPLFIFSLNISEEDVLTKGLDFLGLSKDIRTGDQAFDARFRLKSEIEDLSAKYLALPGVKDGVNSLFDHGADSLALLPRGATIPGAITLHKKRPDLERDLSMQELLPVLETMDRLSSEKLGREFFGKPVDKGYFKNKKPGYGGDHER